MDGWISLHRKLMDNPIWVDSNYLKLWVYCLFKASHKEHDQLAGNQMVKLERGQFITGRFSLAKDMNRGVKPLQFVNERTWWRYLKNFEKFQMLSIKSTNSFSVVTIDKYDFYQGGLSETDQQTVQPLSNDCPTDVQRLSTNNKENKENKENKLNTSSPKSKIYDEESSFYQLALRLFSRIKENNESFKKPNLQKWAEEMRLMIEKDKRTEQQVRYLIDWCQNDSFWKANILSVKKLREKFDQLTIQAKRNNPKQRSLFEQGEESKRRFAEQSKKQKEILIDEDYLEELPF